MFFHNLPKARVIQILIVLQQDQTQIELAERQFQLLRFSRRRVLPEYLSFYRLQVPARLFGFDLVVLGLSEVALEVGEFSGGLCQFFWNETEA